MKRTMQRILAIIGVVLLCAMVITTLVFAITGNKNFLGMMVVTLLLPIFIWIYTFIYKLIKDKNNKES